nr:hypothetical protein Itr_chr11CG07350 [Ipomoea trifida]
MMFINYKLTVDENWSSSELPPARRLAACGGLKRSITSVSGSAFLLSGSRPLSSRWTRGRQAWRGSGGLERSVTSGDPRTAFSLDWHSVASRISPGIDPWKTVVFSRSISSSSDCSFSSISLEGGLLSTLLRLDFGFFL